MTITLSITTSGLTDTQQGDAADTTTPINQLLTILNNLVNGAQDVEVLLLDSLSTTPSMPAANKDKLYVKNDVLTRLDDTGTETSIAALASGDLDFILHAQVFS